jgi:hypothetical protein
MVGILYVGLETEKGELFHKNPDRVRNRIGVAETLFGGPVQ